MSFKEAEEGDVCKQALDGRWFGGRQLCVETWDGVTDYQVRRELKTCDYKQLVKWEGVRVRLWFRNFLVVSIESCGPL